MDFLENLWKRARGVDSAQDSTEDQGGSQHHHTEGVQYEGNEALDSESGSKEIRTYRREGINVIEEYERLNPDGTVTKTISIGDKKNGLKKFEVYRMDKSGIVRRLESASKGDMVGPEEMRESWMNNLRMSDNLKERVANEYDARPNTYDSSNNSRQSLNSLTPEQRTAIFNDFKERLFTYGTNKLKNILIPKLDSNGRELGLTDGEKVNILEAGIQKLHRRLNESVNEEKFFTEVWPRYGLSKNNEQYSKDSSSTHVSFALQPNDNMKQNGSSATKPISFVIRPEFGTSSYSETAPQSRTKSAVNQNNAFTNNIWEDEKMHKYQTKETGTNEPKGVQNITIIESVDDTIDKLQKHFKKHINDDKLTNEQEKQVKVNSLNQTLELMKKNLKCINLNNENMYDDPLLRNILKTKGNEESVTDLIDKLHKLLKLSIKYDPSINKEDKQMKEDFFGIAMDTLKNKIRDRASEAEEHDNRKSLKIGEPKSKEEKSKKIDYDNIEDAYDYGLKAFKKLFKKSLSEQKAKDEISKYLKDYDCSSKRKRVKEDVTYEKQRKIRNDDIFEEEEEGDLLKALSLERKKPTDLWKTFLKRLDDIPSEEKEKRRLVDLHSELKSRSLGRKEYDYSNESTRDNNRYVQKYHPESTTEIQSKSKHIDGDKPAIFDIQGILRKMRNLLDDENESKELHRKSKYNDNYNPQHRQLEMNRKDDSLNENKSESLDYNKIISKLREGISQRANKQIDSNPKQVRQSSPYSYQRPPYGTTKIKTLDPQQNQHNNISFRIQPQEYTRTNYDSPENHQINHNKPCADNDKDFMPWWFGNTPHPNVTKEPLIQAQTVSKSLLGNSVLSDSFFDNFIGNNLSTKQLT